MNRRLTLRNPRSRCRAGDSLSTPALRTLQNLCRQCVKSEVVDRRKYRASRRCRRAGKVAVEVGRGVETQHTGVGGPESNDLPVATAAPGQDHEDGTGATKADGVGANYLGVSRSHASPGVVGDRDPAAPERRQEDELFIFIRFHARPGLEGALADKLREIRAATRSEEGCREIEVYRSVSDPGLFWVHSRWINEHAFEAHTRFPHTVRFLASAPPLLDHVLDVSRSRPIH